VLLQVLHGQVPICGGAEQLGVGICVVGKFHRKSARGFHWALLYKRAWRSFLSYFSYEILGPDRPAPGVHKDAAWKKTVQGAGTAAYVPHVAAPTSGPQPRIVGAARTPDKEFPARADCRAHTIWLSLFL
jgi:hypothetical protein